MARSQAKQRGPGGRRPQEDENASANAPRCWHSGAKQKAEVSIATNAPPAVAGSTSPVGSVATAVNVRQQRGWGELSATERESRCARLQEMGFSSSSCFAALEECSWDVNEALDRLFNGPTIVETCEDTATHSKQTSSRRTKKNAQSGGYDKGRPPQAHNRDVSSRTMPVLCGVKKDTGNGGVASAAGDSTTASGVSTPRLLMSASPQQELSPASSGCDLVESTKQPVDLPPGLEEMPTLLAAPPGLDLECLDQPTPCLGTSEPGGLPQPQQVVPASVTAQPTAPAEAVSVVPKRRLQKVQHTWNCEDEGTQLSVEEGTFVHVWSDSKTDSGWIYAESLICGSRAGWLPESMLLPLTPGRRWMPIIASCSATFPMQLQVEVGNMVMVDSGHDPVNGWVYAEQVASATGRPCLQGLLGAGGWVPIQCVRWAEV